MAVMYGPKTYTPHGLTLNSRPAPTNPAQFTPPAPVAAAPSPMSYEMWAEQNPMRGGKFGNFLPYNGRDGSHSEYMQQKQMQNNAAQAHQMKYLMEMMGGGAVRGGARPAGLLAADPTAMAYANFINRGGV